MAPLIKHFLVVVAPYMEGLTAKDLRDEITWGGVAIADVTDLNIVVPPERWV